MDFSIVSIYSISKLSDACWLLSNNRLDKFEICSSHEERNIIEVFEIDNGADILLDRFACFPTLSSLESFSRCLSVLIGLLKRDFEGFRSWLFFDGFDESVTEFHHPWKLDFGDAIPRLW